MPTGTGKTISLLALFVSYILAYPEKYSKVSLQNNKKYFSWSIVQELWQKWKKLSSLLMYKHHFIVRYFQIFHQITFSCKHL